MLLAPEAVAEGLAPLTSILFAPDVAGNDGLPAFGLGFTSRYSSLVEGPSPLSPFGDWTLDTFWPLGADARGENWREREDGLWRSKSGDLRLGIGDCTLFRSFSLYLSKGDLSRGFCDCLGGDRSCLEGFSECRMEDPRLSCFGLGERPRLSKFPDSR